MILNAGVEVNLAIKDVTPLVLILRPQSGDGQVVTASEINITPETPVSEFRDPVGNLSQRVILQKGPVTIKATCTVEAPDEIAVDRTAPYTLIQDLPDDVLQYLLPSRFCQSDLPVFLKTASRIVRWKKPGYPQAEAIQSWIQKKLKYKYGVSTATTSAVETLRKRAGVCRDFSHLGVSLCRALRIPARVVFGYLHELDPMDLHMWYEAFLGGRWYTFDATQKKPRGNRIIVAYGRDATDVAQITEYGPLKLKNQQVWVNPA